MRSYSQSTMNCIMPLVGASHTIWDCEHDAHANRDLMKEDLTCTLRNCGRCFHSDKDLKKDFKNQIDKKFVRNLTLLIICTISIMSCRHPRCH